MGYQPKNSYYGHAVGAMNYASGAHSHIEGYSNSTSSSYSTFQDALEKIGKAASQCGVSMQEAINALTNSTSLGNAPIDTLQEFSNYINIKAKPLDADASADAIKKINKEIKNSSEIEDVMKDFELPHYDFEDMDLLGALDQSQKSEPTPIKQKATSSIKTKITLRYDTAENWCKNEKCVLLPGEVAFSEDGDTRKMLVGDGRTTIAEFLKTGHYISI